MRLVPLLISAVVTTGLVVTLSMPLGSIPPLGSFLSPQEGFWQNAEPVDQDYTTSLNIPQLKEKVEVYFDDRLVPHVFAQNDEDLYFVQGYLHAKFRLWQMEFQTHAAAGRLSEVVGKGADSIILNFDRNMRRLGMVYAANNSLQVMESDTTTKKVLDAYTAGVNTYVDQLTASNLPLEYRLLNYRPEHWTNLKTALFLKYMSYDLTGSENDIEYTNAKAVLSKVLFDKFYPFTQDSLSPIVPKGTEFPAPSLRPVVPASADSLYFQWKDSAVITLAHKPDKDNGSNNWAVSGQKTQSGRPILCNDPHLGLSLPSLWFEIQLHTPESNAYGASFPGSPAIIIGFNDRIAWGVTNASRDVKDYYAIRFKDESRQEYWFDSAWKPAQLKIEELKVKGGPTVFDTVAYTIFGPVQYDASFNGLEDEAQAVTNLALRWKAHDGSNEFKTFYLLNRATGYTDYLDAIKDFTCPGQNFVFASKDNDIAIWQQGQFPAKWKRQGDFIMPGTDSSYLWQGMIPQPENPHVFPGGDFVSSANQMPADTTYPYYQGGSYDLYRGFIINRKLREMNGITVDDMKELQTSNYNVFAEIARPVLLKYIKEHMLTNEEKNYLELMRSWNLENGPEEKGAAIFTTWFSILEAEVWSDELEAAPKPVTFPESYTLVEAILKDSAFAQADNIHTPNKETVADVVTTALKKAVPVLKRANAEGKLAWGKFKDTGIRHLLRQIAPLGRLHLNTGGGEHIINATKQYHGPSWRMIVHLTDKTEAWGIYPGGQQGNPGSKYYDSFVNDWAAGQYRKLWMMTEGEEKAPQVKYTMTFNKM